jgi:hypothetical protein
MNAIKTNSFSTICIPNNGLVVLDVDDTVMLFKEMGRAWWAEREAELIALHGPKVGRELVMREWVHGAHLYTPVLADPDEFPRFLQRVFEAGAHLIFLTARSAELRDLTEFHLTSCGVSVESENVYFSREKGAALRAIVQAQGFSDVVFIDDMEHNCEDVYKEVADVAELRVYHFTRHAPPPPA